MPISSTIKEKCPTCGHEEVTYEYKFDILHALLLLEMGRHVLARLEKGLIFTAANQVHVPSLSVSLAIRCRTTQTAKLGLIAKCMSRAEDQPNRKRTHIRGTWVVTERGFSALQEKGFTVKIK